MEPIDPSRMRRSSPGEPLGGDSAAAAVARQWSPQAGGWRPPRVNPFSSRFVRPGAIPFLHADLDALIDRLDTTGGWGAFVGPHGSGKSTLVAAFVGNLAARDGTVPPGGDRWEPRIVRLRGGAHRLPAAVWAPFSGRGLVVIDGFELVRWWEARRLREHCRRHQIGLVVTAHADPGLPVLHDTTVTAAIATAVIDRLLTGHARDVLTGYDIPVRLTAFRGSLRSVLDELYDRWESRRDRDPDGSDKPEHDAGDGDRARALSRGREQTCRTRAGAH